MTYRELDAPRSDFSFSHLRDSDFTGADLRGCKFEGARLDHSDIEDQINDEHAREVQQAFDDGEKSGYAAGYVEGKDEGESGVRAELEEFGRQVDRLVSVVIDALGYIGDDQIKAEVNARLDELDI